jgi:uncharacterized protein
VEEWIQRQLRQRQPPVGRRPVMFQRWLQLLFLHWAFAPEIVQRTLPPGLTVDTYAGQAWIGIVPFRMNQVRPVRLPFLSFNFLELNLRTYVKDRHGVPGVWFYSLDANLALAVWTARLFFGLSYLHAKMQTANGRNEVRYVCRRRGSATVQEYQFVPSADLGEAKLGSIEFFLIERYRLFSVRGSRLLTGQVHHSPYHLREAVVSKFDKHPFQLDGVPSPPGPPSSVLYSDRVDVAIYPVESV